MFFPYFLAILVLAVATSGNNDVPRVRRGAAYGGGGYSKQTVPEALGAYGRNTYQKQTVQEALGAYGRNTYQKQTVQEALGAYGRNTYQKQTVQEALGAYGGFAQGGGHYN